MHIRIGQTGQIKPNQKKKPCTIEGIKLLQKHLKCDTHLPNAACTRVNLMCVHNAFFLFFIILSRFRTRAHSRTQARTHTHQPNTYTLPFDSCFLACQCTLYVMKSNARTCSALYRFFFFLSFLLCLCLMRSLSFFEFDTKVTYTQRAIDVIRYT